MASLSKRKGSSFERKICADLSLWVSGGISRDFFWRSAMSGGRGTLAARRGQIGGPAGDICSVSPGGHALTDRYYIELKHYKDLQIDRFLFGSGALFTFWKKCEQEASKHQRLPMMIARQNMFPVLMLVRQETLPLLGVYPCANVRVLHGSYVDIYRLDDVIAGRFSLKPLRERLIRG